ncbi:MAG: alpha/beta hydrolase [Sneathiella sp.]
MFKVLKMVAAYATFFSTRHKLQHASDDYWRRKIGDRILTVDGRVLNPRAQAMIEFQDSLTVPKKHWTPQLVRRGFDKSVELFDGKTVEIASVKNIEVPVGSRNLKLRHYSDETSTARRPCILFFHGGGFVIGSLDGYEKFCRKLARQSRCDVLSLEYRLAPEHKFPAAFEDALQSWDWIQKNADLFHIDPAKVSVAGDSAGAFLAMLVAADASKSNVGHVPLAMGLIYPPIFTTEESHSRQLLGDEKIVLNRDLLEWFMEQFLPEGVNFDDSRFAILDSAQEGRMPPTWILTCGFDPLRDDGRKISDILSGLGAKIYFQEYEDLYHGFITLSGVFPQVQIMIENMSEFFIRQNKPIDNQKETAAE